MTRTPAPRTTSAGRPSTRPASPVTVGSARRRRAAYDRRHGRRRQRRSGQQPTPASSPAGWPASAPSRSGTSATSVRATFSGACCATDAVRRDHGADAAGRGDQHGPAVLDGAQPGHRQLLVRLPGAVVRRVVGLHDEHLGAAADDVADQPVVGDLEADDVADPGRPDGQVAGSVGRREVARDLVEPRDQAGQLGAERDVLAERHRVPLDVALARAGPRVPDDAGVAHVVRPGPVEHGADQHRHADVVAPRRRSAPSPTGRWNGSMSEAFSGQITRSGRGDPAGPDVGRELVGGVDVVAQHLLALAAGSPARAAARCPAPAPP